MRKGSSDPVLIGTVTMVYQGAKPSAGPAVTLYTVTWDVYGNEVHGYLEVGLEKI